METIFPLTMPPSELAARPYSENGEYLQEQLQWLDMCIAFQHDLQTQEAGASTRQQLISRYSDYFERYRNHLQSRMQASFREGVFLPLPYLASVFGLSHLEEKAILVCLAIELDRKYESAYELLLLGGGAKYPTPDLIATLVSRSEAERLQIIRDLRTDGLLRKMFMRNDLALKPGPLLGQPVLLDERIVQFLIGRRGLPEAMKDYANIVESQREPAPLLGNTDVQMKLRKWIEQRANQADESGRSLIISLWGKPGAGKRTQIAHLGHYFQEPLLVVDVAKLARKDVNLRPFFQKVFREATIQQSLLVLTHFRAGFTGEDALDQLVDVLDDIADMSCLVFLLSEEPCQPVDEHHRIDLELEIAALQNDERVEAWRQLAGSLEVSPAVDWEELSARFLFTPGQIMNALKTAKGLAEWESDDEGDAQIGWNTLIKASYNQLKHRLGTKATRLSPKKRWDDLILPELQKDKLLHACNHIRYRHTVYERWGFNKKLSYGTGISLLFSGPPGTGKTMAAEVVAKELDMELYKIDLSQIISKYIGETEKNLRDIFDEAQSSYAILFFDEADALFGKRSEVKDSHDKNANTEVAFLLQKMEEYRGISIMATNYLQNIDEAFLRRINYIIRFPFPDEKQREMIWRHIFPTETPLEEEMNYGFLARKLQMAGGNIKNIALTSAFLASGNKEPVGMKHILKAYQYELDKTNRVLTRAELGEYDYILDE